MNFEKAVSSIKKKSELPNFDRVKKPIQAKKGSRGGNDNKVYTRIGFDPDVMKQMKYKKMMTDMSFTDQVNAALRVYLGM